jgi:hypothetical protein
MSPWNTAQVPWGNNCPFQILGTFRLGIAAFSTDGKRLEILLLWEILTSQRPVRGMKRHFASSRLS